RRVTEFAHDAAIPVPLSTTRTGVNHPAGRIRRTGMRPMLRKQIMTGSTVGLGCLLLAGCGVASSDDGPLPPEVDTAAADSPAPLLSADCEDLVELSVVQDALGEVGAGADPVRVPGGSWPLEHIGLAQAGALDCYWGDD